MKKLLVVVACLTLIFGSYHVFFGDKPISNPLKKILPFSGTPDDVEEQENKKKSPSISSDVYTALWEEQSISISSLPSGMDAVIEDNGKHIYKNFYHGYLISVPIDWKIDNHLPNRYTRFYNERFRLDITVQDTRDAWTDSKTFMKKTLEFIEPHIIVDESWKQHDMQVRLVEYSRPPLTSLKEDFSHYYYGFIMDKSIVYTFQLKTKKTYSSLSRIELTELISTFRSIDKKKFKLDSAIDTNEFNPNIDERFKNATLHIPPNSFMMGVHVENSLDVHTLNQELNTHFGSQLFYKPINSNYDDYFKEMLKEKRVPVITFLFETVGEDEETMDDEILQRIINGEFDKNILSWAKGTKGMNSPVLFRLGNEMNGAWSGWSYKHSYNDADLYVLAYRHFVDIFRSEKVDNAFFVWNPNENSDPYYSWNHASMYYPGDNYVDWVGMTAYNFGKTQWGNFRYFDDLYASLYKDYLISYTSKPFMIGELGSVENGGNKARFIREMFEKIPTEYTNIKMAFWFHEEHQPFNFKISTSPSSKSSFIDGMKRDSVIKYLEQNNQAE